MDPLEQWLERHEAALGFKLLAVQQSSKVALEVLFRPLREKTEKKLRQLRGEKRGSDGQANE